MRVLIASDDPALQRKALKAADVCGIPTPIGFETMERALGSLESTPNNYDCAIIDYRLADLGGLKTIEKLCRRHKQLTAILLLPEKDVEVIRQALRTGICASAPVSLSVTALASILNLIGEDVEITVLSHTRKPSFKRDKAGLSRRELQILISLCEGQQNKEIAHLFGIQEVTVKMHMQAIINKLGAKNRTHAAMIAIRNGIV